VNANCPTPADCCVWALATVANPQRAAYLMAARRLVGLVAEIPARSLLPMLDGLLDPDPVRPVRKYNPKNKYKPDAMFVDDEEDNATQD